MFCNCVAVSRQLPRQFEACYRGERGAVTKQQGKEDPHLVAFGCLLRLARMLKLQQKLLQAENGMAKKAMAEKPEPWNGWYPSACFFAYLDFGLQLHSVACSGGVSGNVFVALVWRLWGLLAAVPCWV